MNKISITSLGLIAEPENKFIQIGDATVEVRPTIHYEEMLDMIQWCIDLVVNDRPFISAPMKKIVMDFAVLNFYTNLDFDFLTSLESMTEVYEAYDFVAHFKVIDQVLPFIDESQMKFFNTCLEDTMKSIVEYRNSAVGIVDTLSASANQSTNDMQQAIDMIKDPEQVEKITKLLNFAQTIQG